MQWLMFKATCVGNIIYKGIKCTGIEYVMYENPECYTRIHSG